jgi:O-antigen ligase
VSAFAPVPHSSFPPAAPRQWPFIVFAAVLVLMTLGIVIGTDGNIGIAVLPLLLYLFIYFLCKIPLRYTSLGLLFLGLTLENPADVPACGQWKSPLYKVGALMLCHINVTIPIKALFFSGVDLVLIFLFGLAFWRRANKSRIDRIGFVPAAAPMGTFAGVCIAGAMFMWMWGMARGGADFASSLWQVQRVVYLPAVFFLFQIALRGPKDHAAIGKVVLAAAIVKAILAVYIRMTVPPAYPDTVLGYAVTHADSMLFAGAFCMLIAQWFEYNDRKRALLCILILPLLSAGMVANNRRMVWVEVAICLGVLYAVTPWTKLKRSIARGVVMSIPAMLIYIVIGWNSGSGVFKPVGVIRSVVDSKSDGSTEWRDWENYNLFFTLKTNPIIGTGYGHGYIESVHLPDISSSYALYRFIPHNSILGLWAFGGLIGFSALWMMLVVGAFFSSRSYRLAKTPADRAAALSATLMLVIYLVHCYGDMGLGTWTAVFLVSAACTVASKLAITTGAWPTKGAVPAAAPAYGPPRVVVTGSSPPPTHAQRPPALSSHREQS